ncbi:redoxin domain-containing protein [Pedobacter sp. PAMC26386]|nr:redoxin domain-containing protein [Pedobacter sp. PAMC26386]
MHQFKTERYEKQLQFIHNHPQSFFSLYALTDITREGRRSDMLRTDATYRSIDPKLRNMKEGQRIGGLIRLRMSGSVEPDFTLYDVYGKSVSLSAFRGNYVALYFWVTGNDLIIAENYRMIKAFKRYKDKNFKIISISLNPVKRKKTWEKEVKENRLAWIQV